VDAEERPQATVPGETASADDASLHPSLNAQARSDSLPSPVRSLVRGMILEPDEADTLQRVMPAMTMEQQVQAAGLLRQYHTEKMRAMVTDLATVDKFAPSLAELTAKVSDPDALRRKIANIAFLSAKTGVPGPKIAAAYEPARDEYAAQNFGKTDVDDHKFHALAKQVVSHEIAENDLLQNGPGSLESMVRSAGSEHRDYTQTFGDWQCQNLDAKGYNPARAGEYYALGRPHYDDALQRSRRAAAATNAASVVHISSPPEPDGMMTADGNVHTPGNGLSGTFAPAQPAFTVPVDPPPSGSAGTGNASAPHLDPVAALGLPGSSPPPDTEQILPGQVFGPPRMDDTPSTPGTLSGPMPAMPRVDGDSFQKMLDSPEFGEVVKKNFPHTLASFTGDMATEWDGDPFAYGPPEHPGRDAIKNAKDSEGGWVGVLTTKRDDKFSAPVLQKEGAPNPGGYISPSSVHADWTRRKLEDPTMPHDPADPYNQKPANAAAANAAQAISTARRKADELPGYYAPARTTPFIAVPFEGTSDKPIFSSGKPGDYVTVVDNYTGRYIDGFVGDARKNSRAEAAVSVSRHFGLGTEGTEDKKRFSYFVYQGSGGEAGATNWPQTNHEIHENAERYRRMNPEVQAAIDAGHARHAATRPVANPGGDTPFAGAQQDID